MTIKELLNMDIAKLEAMSDKELRSYLDPFIKIVEAVKRPKSNSVIDVSEVVARGSAPRLDSLEAIQAYIEQMKLKMASRMGGTNV